MKVLVLGSGGREHALAWKIAASTRCEKVYLHPGNAGTRAEGIATLGELSLKDPAAVVGKALELGISLAVIGPETLLAEGYADELRRAGIAVVGPGRSAARLETSKVFAKEFMGRAGIPTAPFRVVHDAPGLRQSATGQWPLVLKLDGLAAGKGVVIAQSQTDIDEFAKRIWSDGEFGRGPHQVVVESFIAGKEISYLGFCDGKRFLPLPSATDFKRVGNGDTGPNTGGMGVVSPSPYFSTELEARIQTRIVAPVLQQFQRETLDYRGVLYIGLMIDDNGNPHVLEFNTRFGDPETQAVLLRLQSDFIALLEATAAGTLSDCPAPHWDTQTAIYVVGAAEGYPGKPATGDEITGLAHRPAEVQVFYSGVDSRHGKLVTAGGRVLGLGALAPTRDAARKKVYQAWEQVLWRGRHLRTDIGG